MTRPWRAARTPHPAKLPGHAPRLNMVKGWCTMYIDWNFSSNADRIVAVLLFVAVAAALVV